MSGGYSVSLFTDWQRDRINEVWIKSRVDSDSGGDGKRAVSKDLVGARPATKNLHPIAELSAEHCTEQLGVPGHGSSGFRISAWDLRPAAARNCSRNFSCRASMPSEAMLAIQRMGARVGPHLLISEIRTIDADTLWMSPCLQAAERRAAFHLEAGLARRQPVVAGHRARAAPFDVRPHWGKLFTVSLAVLRSRYEQLDAFKKMAADTIRAASSRMRF